MEGEEDLAAMMQLLEAMHIEALPPVEHPEPALHLCRLLRLAHFYSVGTVLREASELLVSKAGSLTASQCAVAMAALRPLADADATGPAKALAACATRLWSLLTPLDKIFDDAELGATFDELPLAAVLEATKQTLLGSSAETGGHGLCL